MPGERAEVVFITGASSGIGAALAKVYAKRGATVCLLARRSDALQSVLSDLEPAHGASHLALAVDVTDATALADAAQKAIHHAGLPDTVIANAGISMGAQIGMAEDLDVISRIMTTNVYATAATFSPFVAPMTARRRGRLVTIASVAAVRGLPGGGAYSASKAAVVVLTESLRVELMGTGVKVITIAPGFIATPMTSRNPYKMPFLLPVDVFAQRAVRAIDAGTSYRVIPWQMGIVAKLLRLAPNWLFDRAFANAKRKPRQNS